MESPNPNALPTRDRIAQRICPSDLVHVRFSQAERKSLRNLAESPSPADQELCIEYLSNGVGVRSNRRFIVEIADLLLPRRSENVRWGAACRLLGNWEYVRDNPKVVWPLVVKWGSVHSHDIRSAIACCVLEEILQFHFNEYFARCKDIVNRGNRRFAETLAMCWRLGEANEPHSRKALDRLLEESGCTTIL